MKTSFTAISSHNHEGGGNGAQLGANAFASNALSGTKFRLLNDESLRGLTTAAADFDILKVDSSDNLRIMANTGKNINFYLNGTHRWGFSSGGDFVAQTGSTSLAFRGSTSDGSDNGRLYISAAGAIESTRGAYIALGGNEHADPGRLELVCGNVSSSEILLRTFGAQPISFYTNSSARWAVESDGDLENNASTGGNLVFNKAGTGVVNNIATGLALSSGGQAGATAITARFSEFTSGGGTQAARLPSSPVAGSVYMIFYNNSANGGFLYPASGGQINAAGTDAAFSIPSANTMVTCCAISSTQWYATRTSMP